MMTLLLVDDNPSFRALLKKALEAEGFAALEADHGQVALKILESTKVDCVISDILMPAMDGFRLCYEIRNNPKLQTLPCILFSSTFDPNSEKNALDFGADRFLAKPTSPIEIAKAVREVVAEKRKPIRKDASPPTEFRVMKEYSETLIRKLEERNTELLAQAEGLSRANIELQQLNKNTVSREQRMIELKRQVNALSKELGRALPYDLSLFDGESARSKN